MTDTDQQPVGNRRLLTDLSQWADPLSKSVAAVAIAVYACGFLIVSLHHSNYGFIGTNPFRPRVLAAGAWFLFLSAIPITAATQYKDRSWAVIGQNIFWFVSVSYGLALPFSWVVFSTEFAPAPNAQNPVPVQNTRSIWEWAAVAGIVVAIIVVGGAVFFSIAKFRLTHPISVAVVSVAIVLCFVANEIYHVVAYNFQPTSLFIWFFGLFFLSLALFKVRSTLNLTEGGEWSRPLAVLFIVLLIFAQYYYPHLKASWGGGVPVSVTIYFTKDSPISPNKAISAQLVEESDEGFYIVGPKETKAIYVPRSAVALVYFSDKVADSPLLRDSK